MLSDHYFFDFGQEKTAGIEFTVPAATAEAWGGAGTVVALRLAEQLGHFDKHSVLFPGLPFDPGNWNKIPKYISQFTLAEGDNYFEQHEYPGLWRYGEIKVKNTAARDMGTNFTLAQWSVGYPWKDEAKFSCSDPMLNSVWQLCYDTIKYNTLDTFTDSNVRERCPYEADGFIMSRSFMALQSERSWVAHSTRFILNNPTWPTEWKQYSVLLVHEHYMQTNDLSIVEDNFDLLVNNTMLPYIDPATNLVNFTNTLTTPMGKWIGPVFSGNSPICHNDSSTFPADVHDGGKSCDNIDWLPKFRAGFHFSPVNTIINGFAVQSILLMAELANATGRRFSAAKLAKQAADTKAAMLEHMYRAEDGMWCDGVCAVTSGSTFHSQHYLLSQGITPAAGVATVMKYLQNQGMVGSTYSSHSLLHGLYDRGRTVDFGQAALELMTQCNDHSWCHMLQLGATATWEHWDPHDGTHSHPWSSTPTSAIAAGMMGIKPVAAGWSQWSAHPAPGNLTIAMIAAPTPKGLIEVNYTNVAGSRQLSVRVPAATEAKLCVPLFGMVPSHVVTLLDGEPKQGRPDDSGVNKDAYLCFNGVAEGSHILLWSDSKEMP